MLVSTVDVVTGADKEVLRTKTKDVTSFDKDLKKLIADLLDTVEKEKGIGLAAPQIGSSENICVAKISGSFKVFVNPKITWSSDQTEVCEEGWLSLPDVWLMVPRAEEIVISFQDEKGERKELKLSGMEARIMQHEIDHLKGVLIIDYQYQDRQE